MGSLVHLATLITLALAVNAAIGPKADLRITNQVIAPDGFNRSAVIAGGAFPGPLIKGNKGDSFELNVINLLHDETMYTDTSIHWHGIHMKRKNWADGTAMVTQCPITPNHSFKYAFPVPDQAGTYWYHSHLRTQYCDGLRGPFVVYDPNDPHKHLYDVDNESTVLSLGDWYHVPSPEIGVPHPDATVFNGIGRSPNGARIPLYVMNVEAGKRYRIRLISMSCEPTYQFSIDGHTMTIIEADGENTQPLEVDSLEILAGQRYSFVLKADKPVGNYWIRAVSSLGPAGFDNGINSAILRYKGAPDAEPTTNSSSSKPLNEANLHALTNPKAPGKPIRGGADINMNLVFTLDTAAQLFMVNGVPFKPPSTPVLLQILSGARTAQELLPPGSVYTLEPNKVVELTMPALEIAGPHPIHLHGHSFSVVRSAGMDHDNFDNPVRRDTVSIGHTGDNVTIRFVTDNSGPWFLHCHMDPHLDLGFAAVFAEDPGNTAKNNAPIPKSWSELCPLYNSSNRPQILAGTNPNLRPITD